jgi:hypothetical protein
MCRAEYSKERSLLEIDCSGCDPKPDLRKPKCLTGALLAFDRHLTIERMILSGTIVKMYASTTVELLSRMSIITDSMSAVRLELNQRFQLRRDLKQCHRCDLDPRRLFGGLLNAFPNDLTEFFSILRCLLEATVEDRRPKCDLCLLKTKGDAIVLLDEALRLRSFALKEGLGIVEV